MEQDYGTPRRRYAPTPAAGPQVPLLFEPSTPTSAQFPRSYVSPVLVRGYSNTDSLRSSTSLGPYPFAREGGPSARDSQVDKYSLSADPVQWGITLDRGGADPDDYLHNPDPRRDRQADRFNPCTTRGILNLGCIFILIFGIVTLFAGYPIITIFTRHKINYVTNTTSPTVFRARSNMSTMALIDPDTPVEHHTRMPWTDQGGVPWKLVFSDEFNVDNRSFYPGDDPFWEAVDLHYWQTGNIEWYDPAAVTTGGGNLLITLSEKNTHNRSYQGGMVSTWNKFCFTGGIIEASVQLPGQNNVHGLWPAFWTMGNLGRAGYGASLEGMWPYSYDDCDVGTVANQTDSQTGNATRQDGDQYNEYLLSFTPGQRLSRCSCPGSSHPGPKHSDGSFVGRAAPEIDVFEAQTSGKVGGGEVSQSAQWAPFNYGYQWSNVTGTDVDVFNTDLTHVNSYTGGVYQQPTSYVTSTDQACYEKPGPGCYSVYAFEYKPGYDDGYIAWMSAGVPSWTVHAHALSADPRTMIKDRPIPQEPLYVIFNLGMSDSFGKVDYDHLTFPNTMSVDYVRVYQHPDKINVNCSPDDFPTATYIEQYMETYTNPNLTTWKGPKESGGFEQDFPKNSWLNQC